MAQTREGEDRTLHRGEGRAADRLDALRERVAPVTLARDRTRPVPRPLLPLFPSGGLPRGEVVGVRGSGGWSIALALAGAALGEGGWLAVVGVEELGMLAATQYGIRLDRLLLVESQPPDRLAPVVASLVEAVDLVALAPHRPVGHRDARRLVARCREREAGLLLLDGGDHWPLPPDLVLTTSDEQWSGLGRGHGHLRHRRLTVTSSGRRAFTRPRRVTVLAPGPDGGVTDEIIDEITDEVTDEVIDEAALTHEIDQPLSPGAARAGVRSVA